MSQMESGWVRPQGRTVKAGDQEQIKYSKRQEHGTAEEKEKEF